MNKEDKIEELVEEELVEDELVEEEGEEIILSDSFAEHMPVPETVEEDVKLEGDGRKFSEMSNLEKIKIASAQNGVAILPPKKNCKKCYGTGIVSVKTVETMTQDTSASPPKLIKEELPNPCRCIFKKEDRHKMFTGNGPISRDALRKERKPKYRTSADYIKINADKQIQKKKKRDKKKMKKKMMKKYNKRG